MQREECSGASVFWQLFSPEFRRAYEAVVSGAEVSVQQESTVVGRGVGARPAPSSCHLPESAARFQPAGATGLL